MSNGLNPPLSINRLSRARSSNVDCDITPSAPRVVECAIVDKQGWAFQQIADRLEGKPVQVVNAMVDDHRTLQQFSDAELTAILRRRVSMSLGQSDEERPEDAALN